MGPAALGGRFGTAGGVPGTAGEPGVAAGPVLPDAFFSSKYTRAARPAAAADTGFIQASFSERADGTQGRREEAKKVYGRKIFDFVKKFSV